MTCLRLGSTFLLAAAAAAQTPLPELRVEAIPGGSVLYIRNVSTQPVTALLIELVDYPGSSYSLWHDDVTGNPIAPGTEKRIQIGNMTVGAVPDYVKLRAALYADGASSGIPEKVTQLVERRRFVLETTRELVRRLEEARTAGTPKAMVSASLKQWSESLPPARAARNSQAAINQAAARSAIGEATARLETQSLEEVLAACRAAERALASSKPSLEAR